MKFLSEIYNIKVMNNPAEKNIDFSVRLNS